MTSFLKWSGCPVVMWKTTAAELGSARKEELSQVVSKYCSEGKSENMSSTVHFAS